MLRGTWPLASCGRIFITNIQKVRTVACSVRLPCILSLSPCPCRQRHSLLRLRGVRGGIEAAHRGPEVEICKAAQRANDQWVVRRPIATTARRTIFKSAELPGDSTQHRLRHLPAADATRLHGAAAGPISAAGG